MSAFLYLLFSLILIKLKFSNETIYKSKKIIIAPLRVSPSSYLEFLYGCYLAKKGADISAIIDINNILNKCNYSKQHSLIEKRIKNILIKLICFISNIKIIPISKEKKISISKKYISEHIKSEQNRLIHTKKSLHEKSKDLSDSIELEHKRIYKTLEGIKITKNTSFFFSHGIYSWGPIYDFCITKNLNYRIYYSLPYFKNKLYISKENAVTGLPDIIQNNSNNKSNREAKEVIESRLNYLSNDQKTFKKNSTSSESLKEKLKKEIKKYNNVISFFPNVLFDNNISQRDSIFNGLIECINETIDNLKEENLLIIRAHPAEAVLWSKYTKLKSYIKKRKNVFFINPEEKISSYFIAKLSDLSVIYDGIMTVELSYLNLPVCVPSKSKYYFCPGNFKVSNKEEFFDLINNIKLKNIQFSTIKNKQNEVASWIQKHFFDNGITINNLVEDGSRINFNLLLLILRPLSFLRFVDILINSK